MIALSFVFAASVGAAEVQTRDLTEGEGAKAARNHTVVVHYTGWLEDGTQFDSSHDRDTPFSLVLGMGQVIPGWEMGIDGMRVGGKRELIIPPELAYGPAGAGGVIPPNATLRFEVELLDVQPPPFGEVDNAELKALMDKGYTVIDVRRPDEWRETGVVEGSHLLTAFDDGGNFVQSFPAELHSLVKPDEPVVIICRVGNRTGLLARAMAEQAGYEQVYNVTDGITAWIADGRPVKKDCPRHESGAQC
ncbi:peptidylprolyl isomerase [Thioalkalivibrio denitrificans]|uniref:Peptidyl-prolyl cis-trans isomerase n=1 Tax=Thioalkalivibrio denitrificans TaxID=108003 RepID=A0A1V3NQB7_9GAMM|nr:FKBP-type peptidyl-prolyl cis-trans isomerase [Thioalkalivibrio denitrificans]OOG27194.1 peptidylprolyl isomerase [Thioalkalivibrio denitrificans]